MVETHVVLGMGYIGHSLIDYNKLTEVATKSARAQFHVKIAKAVQ